MTTSPPGTVGSSNHSKAVTLAASAGLNRQNNASFNDALTLALTDGSSLALFFAAGTPETVGALFFNRTEGAGRGCHRRPAHGLGHPNQLHRQR